MTSTNPTKRILSETIDDEPNKKKAVLSVVEIDNEAEAERGDVDEEEPGSVEEDEVIVMDESAEKNVGICEYVNPNAVGIFGVVKQRLSDFQVHEIEPVTNNAVYLTNFDLPIREKPKEPEIDPNLLNKVKTIIGDEKFAELIEFCKLNDRNEKFSVNAPKEKSDKKLFHDFIREHYKDYVSNTLNGTRANEQQTIEVFHRLYKGSNSNGAFNRNSNSNRNKMDYQYCQCVLYKENIDTLQAVNTIARNLRIQTRRVNYAGTKDKRAKTTQLLSFFKISPEQLVKLNEKFNIMKLGNFSLTNNQLKLGDLNGNRFTIVLRQITCTDDGLIDDAVRSLAQNGFINYYGLQRFGTSTIPTHEIGLQLLLNNYKEAVELILKPRSTTERDEIRRAREIWSNERNAHKAYNVIVWSNCVEKFLLHGLTQCAENDYLGAFNFIPRNMRLMYVHAYQSYAWNRAASERVRRFGLKPVDGDLVYNNGEVTHVNEENRSKYTIEDILLPLPGYTTVYPKNQIHEVYKSLLTDSGLNIDNMRHKVKDLSLSGDYRQLIIKPKHVQHTIVYHNDNTSDLVLSDLEKVNGAVLGDIILDEDAKRAAPCKSLVIEFNLQSSSYATMALRELTKLNSSKYFQSTLNK